MRSLLRNDVDKIYPVIGTIQLFEVAKMDRRPEKRAVAESRDSFRQLQKRACGVGLAVGENAIFYYWCFSFVSFGT